MQFSNKMPKKLKAKDNKLDSLLSESGRVKTIKAAYMDELGFQSQITIKVLDDYTPTSYSEAVSGGYLGYTNTEGSG